MKIKLFMSEKICHLIIAKLKIEFNKHVKSQSHCTQKMDYQRVDGNARKLLAWFMAWAREVAERCCCTTSLTWIAPFSPPSSASSKYATDFNNAPSCNKSWIFKLNKLFTPTTTWSCYIKTSRHFTKLLFELRWERTEMLTENRASPCSNWALLWPWSAARFIHFLDSLRFWGKPSPTE